MGKLHGLRSRFYRVAILTLVGGIGMAASWPTRAQALPGQRVLDVALWMQDNPTIQPAPGEALFVQRTDSPSRRFTFQASITSPGQLSSGDGRDIIRSETISLFDTVYGVSQARLIESLGFIYGNAILQDYESAQAVLVYPTAEMITRAKQNSQPLLELTKGEVRQGEHFVYWVEVVENPDGVTQNGRITVLLPEDLPKLVAQLESR
ncbi:MAG: hypothetical protein ACKO7W_02860 [Elainella sp.]